VRLARVRFTVGGLMLCLAICAMNFTALRWYYSDGAASLIDRYSLEVAAGSLPLFDIAVIGLTRSVSRRLRLCRRSKTLHPPPSPPWFSFIGLQFLALAALATRLRATANYLQRPWFLLHHLTEVSPPFAQLDGLVASYAGNLIYLFALVSGPLIVLSWVGSRLVCYATSAFAPRRSRAVTGLVSTTFAGIALAVTMIPEPFCEWREIPIEFQVVDRDLGRPIRGAFVRLTDAFRSMNENTAPSGAFTDLHGRATLTDSFLANGDRTAFHDVGVFTPWGHWLEVSAADYRTLLIALPDVLGLRIDLRHPGLGRAVLERGKTPEATCCDIAGRHDTVGGYPGEITLQILPDGRYACTWLIHGLARVEYGYVQRGGEKLELIPIPSPDGEKFPLLSVTYRTIQWGDRTYMTPNYARMLMQFCRAALTRSRAEWRQHGGHLIFVRATDLGKAPTGLPRLPAAVWALFVLDEISLRDQDGIIRMALDNLIDRFHLKRSDAIAE
jgi:hypothetical protein